MVFEAGINGRWLSEISERELSSERIVLANPFETRDAHHCSRRRSRPIRWTRGFWPICYASRCKKVRRSSHVRDLPGMGPILPALVVTEIDGQRLVFREPGSVLYGCVSTSPAHATS